jgi:hypothetical protein
VQIDGNILDLVPREEPDLFLRYAYRIFKSAYLRATRASEDPTSLATIRQSLRPNEQQWFTNLVSAWGEKKVLRMWESLRLQLEFARNL